MRSQRFYTTSEHSNGFLPLKIENSASMHSRQKTKRAFYKSHVIKREAVGNILQMAIYPKGSHSK